ncbi:alpha/beta hydrolase [Sporomusa aerivorans]|uniref:alpha/beta hydrolase n=1 Tax=Sporomusa aerivorans TaxID=204936 RepID=UPI00352BB6A5
MKKKVILTNVFKILSATALGLMLFTSGIGTVLAADEQPVTENLINGKTFPPSDKVMTEKVSYKNRYGVTIAADLYLPKNINKTTKHKALVIGTPYGGVKEQGAGIYAQTMAERGFVAIAFDESYNGESGGDPRHVSSPDIFTEDFSAGVDYLGTLPYVDREKIGAIGICGSGGFALTAAQFDRRIKAVATASMYDMSRVKRNGLLDRMTPEEKNKHLDELAEQRWKDVDSGLPQLTPPRPTKIPEKSVNPIADEFIEYYVGPRGHHPNSIGAFTVTSDMAFMNFPLLNYIDMISPRPILFIMGENAHSRYFTEDTYKRAVEPKELYIVKGARHIDLYDRKDIIPFDKLDTFFSKYLK